MTTAPPASDRACDPAFDAFMAAWPSAAHGDEQRAREAWDALAAAEQTAAMQFVPVFLNALAALRREHVPAARTFLIEKRWEWVT